MKNVFSNIPILKTNKYYSTQELSQLLKANESTIKRWADSGKLKCFKTPGGHRKYTTEHISEFLTNYHYEIISPERAFSSQEQVSSLDLLVEKEDYQGLSELIFGYAESGAKEHIFEVLKACHTAGISLVIIYDEIIGRVLRNVLSLREQGKFSFTEEQISRNALSESLFQFRLLSQKVFFTQKVAVTCSAITGIHEIGLMCAEHLLEISGWKVFNLGVGSKVDVLNETILKSKAELVCLTSDYLGNGHVSATGLNEMKQVAVNHQVRLLFADFDTKSNSMLDKQFEDFSLLRFSTYRDMFTMLYDKH